MPMLELRLEVTDEDRARFARWAKQRGVSVPVAIEQLLKQRLAQEPEPPALEQDGNIIEFPGETT